MGMLAVGLLFKVGAAPFHAWTPDVYQGAPTAVTGFMAACTKVAAFGALLRLFYVAFGGARWDWQPMMWVVAILTMVVGSVLALAQTDIKRMLAYSSVAHAGFLLTGLLGARSLTEIGDGRHHLAPGRAVLPRRPTASRRSARSPSSRVVRDAGGEATHLSRWAGLGKQSPLLGGRVRASSCSRMAGIPLTAGFIGKWAVFAVGAVRGCLAGGDRGGADVSVVAAYFYVRVIVRDVLPRARSARAPTSRSPSRADRRQ